MPFLLHGMIFPFSKDPPGPAAGRDRVGLSNGGFGASKPVSRVLSFKTAIYLDAPLPARSSRLPGTVGPTCVSLHGVAPDRVYSDGRFHAVG